MSTAPDGALLAQIRSERETKVCAELTMATPLIPPLSSQPVGHGAAVGRSGIPGITGICPSTSIISTEWGVAGLSVVNPGHVQACTERSSSPTCSDVELLAAGAEENKSVARKPRATERRQKAHLDVAGEKRVLGVA